MLWLKTTILVGWVAGWLDYLNSAQIELGLGLSLAKVLESTLVYLDSRKERCKKLEILDYVTVILETQIYFSDINTSFNYFSV